VLLASIPRPVYLLASLRLTLENFSYLTDQPCVSQEPTDSLINHIQDIKRADSTAIVIVSLHWGGEHTLRPIPQQRMEAHRLIDAGADALICHHTHTLQSMERYKNRPIYYSIGNFIFDQHNPLNAKAGIVRLHINKNSISDTLLPITIHHCSPYLSGEMTRELKNSEAKSSAQAPFRHETQKSHGNPNRVPQ
jgi:poly-gamma-glutamate synthesis protein (capsule biosynthesis protein)